MVTDIISISSLISFCLSADSRWLTFNPFPVDAMSCFWIGVRFRFLELNSFWAHWVQTLSHKDSLLLTDTILCVGIRYMYPVLCVDLRLIRGAPSIALHRSFAFFFSAAIMSHSFKKMEIKIKKSQKHSNMDSDVATVASVEASKHSWFTLTKALPDYKSTTEK